VRPQSIEQGWRTLLAKVIIQALRDAREGNIEAYEFLYSEGCVSVLEFFLGEFNLSMIGRVIDDGCNLSCRR
jgi:hypothetical protein